MMRRYKRKSSIDGMIAPLDAMWMIDARLGINLTFATVTDWHFNHYGRNSPTSDLGSRPPVKSTGFTKPVKDFSVFRADSSPSINGDVLGVEGTA
jgi:hypothetical protein